MIFPDTLTSSLNELTTALDDPGTDLQAILDVLIDDVSTVVSSFLGLTLTLQLDGFPVTLTAAETDLAPVSGASLELTLSPLPGGGVGGSVVFYARQPGAFVDLATDLQILCAPGGRVVLDGHRPGASDPPHQAGVTGLAELGLVNRAIGVLITRGYTPIEAHAELRRRAADTLHSVPDAAADVLNSTNTPPHNQKVVCDDPGHNGYTRSPSETPAGTGQRPPGLR
jgi:hypothetical protein